ncbi:hypothetical protein [Kineococcus sp. SYSU DK002]|uniref:hypothetical protein n=1 Tax=Kineococcus sp. SYSU DK002 TaxID=3383123 RepID=UPI003D7DA229
MNPTRTGRRSNLRAASHARLQEQRQQPLPAWLATRTARRALALLPVATFALGVLAATAGGGFNTALISGATALTSYALAVLRRATRMLDNVPENLLDEREISDRDHAYRRGFRLTLLLLGALTLLAVLNSFLVQEAGVQLFEPVGWMVLLVASFLTATMLPAAALAWNWREPVLEPDDFDE